MKKLLALSMMVSLVALLAGASLAQTTIRYWYWNPPEQFAQFEPLIKDFEKKTGIHVETLQVASWDMQQKFTVAAVGNVAPDVLSVSSSWAEQLAELGSFVDLRQLMKRDNYGATDFFPPAVDLWKSYTGEQYAFPFDLDIKQLWYNKEVLDKTGVAYPNNNYTWQRWLDDAVKIGRDVNGDGKPDQYAISDWWWNWLSLIPANGGQFFNVQRTAHTLRSPEAREAIEYWGQWWPNQKNTLLLQENVVNNLGIADNNAAFKAGKVAFAGGGAYLASAVMWDPQTSQYRFDFDVTGMPISNNGKRFTELAGQGLAISAQSANIDAAWQFVKFMTSPEVQRISFGQLGQFSVRRSVALSDVYLGAAGPPANKIAFIEGAGSYGGSFPKGVLWPQSSEIIKAQLERFYRGQASLEDAFTQMDILLKPVLDNARSATKK